MILFALGLPFPHGFVFGNSRATSQWVTHLGSALASFSLNFGVPTEPGSSFDKRKEEFSTGSCRSHRQRRRWIFHAFGGGHVHIRHITSYPSGDVGYYNPPSLGARRPHRHTSCCGVALITN
ncbi:hypothetical protein DVH24_025942 [Malus domestica]|uniref:Uncharacterized protein n=1 Tax=Malus domestica TaxID=3750 RepID=A0A498KHD1_MALDO|nr:hypothetical protein DVH24_025942 [Malus domestica]